MESPHCIRRWVAIALLILLAAVLTAGCTGIVVEPTDESTATSWVKFWGYTPTAREAVRLEAQSTSWEQLTTGTSSSVPTYTGGSGGYYYELWFYMPTLATRFRKTSPYAGYWRATLRVATANGVAVTRQVNANSAQPTTESWIARLWFTHTTTTGNIRIDVRQ
jgi:hypothetical protein